MTQGSYRHTQRSYFCLPVFAVVATIFFAVAWTMPEPQWLRVLFFVLAPLMLALGFVFSSLTIIIDTRTISWHFGLGFWKKSISRSAIVKVHAVKTNWWDGWGIRITPTGWLYNVSGFDAVAITTQQDRTVLIGTDEPDAVIAALGF